MSHTVNDGGIRFFESRVGEHSAVETLVEISNQLYRIERSRGDTLIVYLTGMYVLGLYDYHDLRREHGVNSIVLAGPWLTFTPDVKEQAVQDHVGLFKVKGFLGSLNRRDRWNYDGPAIDD